MGASSYLKAFAGLLLITNLLASPVAPETELVETRNSEEVTLATELKPPPLDKKDDDEEHGEFVVYLINVFAVKNNTAETSEEALDDDVIQNNPEMMEPLVSVLLVLEVNEDNSNDVTNAVDLKELADELIKEGFKVERIQDGDETKLLRVNLESQDVNDVISSTSRTKPKSEKMKEKKKKAREEEKIRRKRTICIKCNDGGYQGGGNYYPENPRPYPSGGSVAVLPVIAVPISIGGNNKRGHHGGQHHQPPPNQGNYYPQPPPVYPQPPPVYPQPPPVYPQPRPVYPEYPQPRPVQPVYHPQPSNGCNTCNNGGGGGGSSAHAEASASAHSSSW